MKRPAGETCTIRANTAGAARINILLLLFCFINLGRVEKTWLVEEPFLSIRVLFLLFLPVFDFCKALRPAVL